jgi:hypothetical protein
MSTKTTPDYEISTLFWGAIVVVAVFITCFASWKLVELIRNHTTSGGRAVNIERVNPRSPDAATSTLADCWDRRQCSGLGYMTPREEEDFRSIYGPRKVRRAIREGRRLREQRVRTGVPPASRAVGPSPRSTG